MLGFFFGGNVEVSELILGIRGKMCERTCIPIGFSCCFSCDLEEFQFVAAIWVSCQLIYLKSEMQEASGFRPVRGTSWDVHLHGKNNSQHC